MATNVHPQSAADAAASAFIGSKIRSSCLTTALSILAIAVALVAVALV
ncbi:hypothetical protein HH308_24485 [Gordonia sp. TBRC 11910]|uniref:Uncharacterized protein n=1 Tax=Gordonia asplenii TaxID=2725283 RepID=A0A848L1Q3_9ACTN|nr:hypothetical protein [Gordonia asplenii]NMO04382.1 hypothetical protein [Gordonia asplenii]